MLDAAPKCCRDLRNLLRTNIQAKKIVSDNVSLFTALKTMRIHGDRQTDRQTDATVTR